MPGRDSLLEGLLVKARIINGTVSFAFNTRLPDTLLFIVFRGVSVFLVLAHAKGQSVAFEIRYHRDAKFFRKKNKTFFRDQCGDANISLPLQVLITIITIITKIMISDYYNIT